jgi:acyl-CoA hydrolase
VTASFDQVDFRSPIQIGEVVTMRASVNTAGRTSMEIGVKVTAEPVTGGSSRHTNSCYVTMVALDPEGRPCAVPKLEIGTEDEYRRYRDAEERRAARLELAKRRRSRREPSES